jgi:hypothetical protein
MTLAPPTTPKDHALVLSVARARGMPNEGGANRVWAAQKEVCSPHWPHVPPTVAARCKARPWVSGSPVKLWGGRGCSSPAWVGCSGVSVCENWCQFSRCHLFVAPHHACSPTWQTRFICYVVSVWGSARLRAAPEPDVLCDAGSYVVWIVRGSYGAQTVAKSPRDYRMAYGV